MYLIQILLPLYSNDGKPFTNDFYTSVKEEITQVFRGVTIYSRAPAVGIWKEDAKNIRDEIIIFEVMAENIKSDYWNAYKFRLQNTFKQDVIIIRASKIELL